MTTSAPFGGKALIADTSAWHRAPARPVHDEWGRALAGGQIATTPAVVLELLYSTRDAADFDAWETELRLLREVPITRSVTRAAVAALRTLAHAGPLRHRVPAVDALVAAAAQDAGLGVLHYDRHFDRLATVLDFESVWIAPPDSL